MPKQFRPLGGKPVLRWAVEALIGHPAMQATSGRDRRRPARACRGRARWPRRRRRSSAAAPSARIRSAPASAAIDGDAVLVHDAARPFCPPAVVDRLIASLEFYEGAAPVLPVGDTLARVGDQLDDPVDRTGLVRVQTRRRSASTRCGRPTAGWSGASPDRRNDGRPRGRHERRRGRRAIPRSTS